jgi:alanine dehydrogenase
MFILRDIVHLTYTYILLHHMIELLSLLHQHNYDIICIFQVVYTFLHLFSKRILNTFLHLFSKSIINICYALT